MTNRKSSGDTFLPQQQPIRHVFYPSRARSRIIKSNGVPNSLPQLHITFLSNPFGNGHSCNTSRLSNPNSPPIPTKSRVKQKLWQLYKIKTTVSFFFFFNKKEGINIQLVTHEQFSPYKFKVIALSPLDTWPNQKLTRYHSIRNIID